MYDHLILLNLTSSDLMVNCVHLCSPIGDLRPSPYLVIAQVSGRVVNDSAKFENSNVKITFETQVIISVVVDSHCCC